MTLLFAGTTLLVHPVSADSFNDVQIFVTTSAPQAYNFQFAAYNLTGSLVASAQTSYSAAAFELPSGEYLFTASATNIGNHIGFACPLAEGGTSQAAGTASASTPTKSPSLSPVLPIPCYPPSSEYGYATASISGPRTIGIHVQNTSTIPTTPVTIKASYTNGTAAADTSVYASVVGEWYFSWGPNSSVIMGAQTNGDGIAHLVIPVAPAVVTAWKWIPIFTSSNGSSVQTTIGGQKVNVAAYWQPTYIGLSGSGLLIPPENDINVTLSYQQPDYWVMPGGVVSKGAYSGATSTGTVANQPGGVPSSVSPNSGTQGSSQYYLPTQIPAIPQAAVDGSMNGNQTSYGMDSLIVASIAFVTITLVVVLLAVRHRTNRPSAPTG
jgi:hypothetical protein